MHTAPDHFLGDFPAVKWRSFANDIPADLTGKTVLDIGCNGGFYAMEMKRRGADRVLGIDFDEDYLNQARFAAEVEGLDVEFRRMSVYDLGALAERFDVVFFIGVLYHLRHPLLALDLVHEHVTRDLLVFQSMQRGSNAVAEFKPDYEFWEQDHFDDPGYPKMHFIEHDYAHDCTNWWAPNRACSAAMLRSAGYEIVSHPEEEMFICRHVKREPGEYGAVIRQGVANDLRDSPMGFGRPSTHLARACPRHPRGAVGSMLKDCARSPLSREAPGRHDGVDARDKPGQGETQSVIWVTLSHLGS